MFKYLLIFFSFSLIASENYYFNLDAKFETFNSHAENLSFKSHYFKNSKAQNKKLAITVHGYLDNCSYMNYIHDFLWKKDYSILCIDLPGHGQSHGERADISSFSDYGKIIPNLPTDVLKNYPNKIFIAHSTGAVVFHEYVRHNDPPAFDRVILLAPLVRSTKWTLSVAGSYMFGRFIKEVKRKDIDNLKLKHHVSEDPSHIDKMKTHWFSELKKWNDELLKKQKYYYGELIVLFPEDDEVIDTDYNKDFYKKYFPSAKIQLLDDTTHRIQFDDDEIVKNFFKVFETYLP